MDERTTVEVKKSTRDRLARAKYDLGQTNYDEAVLELIEIYEQLENPSEILEN
jgi:hypothetical protein